MNGSPFRFLLVLFTLLFALPLSAEERILGFDSNIMVLESGDLDVIETIRVRAEGRDIRRGIFRDIPTEYEDRYGNRFRSQFELLTVERDDIHEDHHTEAQSNGIRIYIGDANRVLKPGEYEYRIHYRMNRQLGFFAEHDELYWNVTGTGWSFPIDRVTAAVTLPGVPAATITTEAYTGAQGAQGRDYGAHVDTAGIARFETTRPLPPYQGLTLVVGWPKGYVQEPDSSERLGYWMQDNRPQLIGLGGLILLLGYYLLIWHRIGRDPTAGVVIPLYEPPKGYSPASMRFIEKMGYDHKCFATALVNLAVKGYLKIDDAQGDDWLLQKTGQDVAMAPGERVLSKKLFGSSDHILLKQSNHQRIRRAMKAHKASLRANYESLYFVTNKRYLIPGILISLAYMLASVLAQPNPDAIGVSLFMSIWLTGWSVGTYALAYGAWKAWRTFFSGGGGFIQALSLSVFALPFIGGWFMGIGMLTAATSIGFLIILIVTIAINVLFYQWLKAPTLAGRRLLDKIDGFRHYMVVAEGDELANKQQLQDLELFERYLPYALALDVEQAWAERFAAAMKRFDQDGEHYQPRWYHGRSWSSARPGRFASALGGGLSTAIASSSTAPGSSSGGGGGGFSGGGGGGGGGGGW